VRARANPTLRIAYDGRVSGDDSDTFGTLIADANAMRRIAEAEFESRYEDRGLLGRGGMGEVRRVYDRELQRVVAMKLLLPRRMNERALAHFVREARLHADLQHPGIVPVHDTGHLPDGRRYFTMREVHGQTLAKAISDGMGLHALLAAFRQACQAVAYAHDRGVIHRDLKPANVMLGPFGEVLVLDWGIARGPGDSPDLGGDGEGHASGTREGQVKGSPRYMAPEQARGQRDLISTATDVYGLGAMLYQILAREAPFADLKKAREVIAELAAGLTPLPPSSILPVPEDLEKICLRAMAARPADRFADAGALSEAVGAWLDGEARRARAREVTSQASAILEEAGRTRLEGWQLTTRAQDLERSLAVTSSLEAKRPLWSLEEQSAEQLRTADVRQAEGLALLRLALSHDPDAPEAHAALAAHYRDRHEAAETDNDLDAAAALEVHLSAHDRAFEHAPYLRGLAKLTLHTDPPGAEVELFRFESRDRRSIPVSQGVIGTTPLDEVTLPRGSWLCAIRKPGHLEVRYPVSVGRLEHWDGVRPGDADPLPIALPVEGQLDNGDCYVPAGWAWLGGGDLDSKGGGVALQQVWVDAFVIRRHPVTNGEFIAFLDAISARDGIEAALSHVPREGLIGDGAAIYSHQHGRFAMKPDSDGDLWDLDWPVMQIDWHAALAFAEHSGWRLPTEWERERACRGADGRLFPWGTRPEALFARCRHSDGPPGPERIGRREFDRSVYGVEGLGGNVMDWCYDAAAVPGEVHAIVRADDDKRSFRGGSWNHLPQRNASDQRYENRPGFRHAAISVRLARTF